MITVMGATGRSGKKIAKGLLKALSILFGCKGIVALKVGHHGAHPEHKKFVCHDIISSRLQECLGQSGLRVPALAAKHADHGRHDCDSRTSHRESVLVDQYLAGVFNRFSPLTSAEQRITQTEEQVFFAYRSSLPAERDRAQMCVAGPIVVGFEISKVRQ
jgi:hypothetical protein